MLSAEHNDLLSRVGPASPMGEMLRNYWWPVLRSEQLEIDGAPIRVRLMGENYVAFRATDGRVGVFDERCPHRGVSLILHGWKISVDGKVLETPNEKERGARVERLKVRRLEVNEAAGLVWVWAGKGLAPAFPNYAFTQAKGVNAMIGRYRCNWFQMLETLWDPSHVQILHASDPEFTDQFLAFGDVGLSNKVSTLYAAGPETQDTPVGFNFRFTEGVCSGGGIPAWIATAMPSWVLITSFAENPSGDRVALGHVPIDDENMLLVQIFYNMDSPLGDLAQFLVSGTSEPDNFVPQGQGYENNWGQDRAAMKQGSFTGVGVSMYATGILLQDQAAIESMGPIVDRTAEQIGPADHAVVKGRTVYLDALKAYLSGAPALGIGQDFSCVGRPGGLEYAGKAAISVDRN
jgi:phthalate 4,5-dioxygenase